MRIEHHLLALAHVGPHEHHSAVAEPDMRHLHSDCHAVDPHDLVAPVELVSLARRIIERHIGLGRHRPAGLRPVPGIAADRVVAALIADPPEFFENPDQGQPLP